MSTILNVLKKPSYAIIAIVISLSLGILFWMLTFYFTPSPLPAYIEMYGLPFTITTIILGSVIAILTGINTAMIIYRKKMTGSLGFKKGTSSTACGTIAGAVASGCPVCTMPLLGIFGLAGTLALFPMQGLELKIAAVAILVISLYFTSKNVRITCKI